MKVFIILMLLWLAVLVAIGLWMVHQFKNAPMGYEDKTGFHLGDEPDEATLPRSKILPKSKNENRRHRNRRKK